MKYTKYIVVALLCLSLIGPLLPSKTSDNKLPVRRPEINSITEGELGTKEVEFALSDDTSSGVLNPISVVHTGYSKTSNMTGSTENAFAQRTNLTLDTANGWVASKAELEVYNVHKIYAYNGSFDSGYYPWQNSTYDASGGSQTQIANYDTDGGYVTAINYGELKTHPIAGDSYIHHTGSEIVWSQVVTNSPLSDSFLLSFDFRYVSGPLDFYPYDFSGDVLLEIYVNNGLEGQIFLGSGDIAARNTWYGVNDYQIDIPGAPASFKLEIGLYIVTQDIELQESGDYDDDGYPDGLINAQKIELNLDNIEFVSTLPVDCPTVEMKFHIGELNDSIIDVGEPGTSTITNPDYWSTDPLEIMVTANNTVSFDYNVRLTLHKITTSSWTADPNKHGVTYSVSSGRPIGISFYTYISAPDYENTSVRILHPWDWENGTVLDPLLNDLTSQCTITSEYIEIPNSLMDRLGWWQISLDAHNYAKNMNTQIYDTSIWTDNSIYRSNNISRLQFELGTSLSTPVSDGSQLNLTWILPNSTIWAQESITSWTSGVGYSSQYTLGALNTSAGQWSIELIWTNGTELAFDVIIFDVYHATALSPVQMVVETDVGLTITNLLYYIDSDNGEYLMDDVATIESNWSSTIVSFAPNLIRNWWEADFDTNVIGGGEFTVVVNASRTYYDFATCSFTVLATYSTTLDVYNTTAITPFNTPHILKFNYRYANGTGVENAQATLEYSGPTGGLSWESLIETSPGEYEIAITGSQAGTYSIFINGTKLYHQYATDSMTLTVQEVATSFVVLNGTTGIISAGSTYRVVVTYTNSTGHGLQNATVVVESTLPSTGITVGLIEELGNGQYSIMLSPADVAIYNIVFKANLTNHVTAFAAFALTATQVPTTLTLAVSTVTVGVTESFTLVMQLDDESLVGVEDATIFIIDPPAGLFFNPQADHGSGNYSIQIDALQFGTYLITVSASTPNYQDSIDSFTLIVEEISTNLILVNGSADFAEYNELYTFVIRYTNVGGTGLLGADIQIVSVTPDAGLLYGLFQTEMDGYYSIQLQPIQSTVFSILLRANLTNHQVQYSTFTLTVREIATRISLNVTSTTISVADSLSVEVKFTGTGGDGISGANITILNPPAGLSFANHFDHLNGNYTFNVIPFLFGSYLVTVSASLPNHQSGFTSFSIVVDEIGTQLLRINGTSDLVRIGEEYRLVLRYLDSKGSELMFATLIVADLNPTIGLSYGNASYEGDGYYSILLTPTLAKTFTLVFRANLTNYVTQFTTFSLTVSEIPTVLTIDRSEKTVSVDQKYSSILHLEDDMDNPLDGATIFVLNPPSEILFNITPLPDGNYNITMTFSQIGIYQIAFRATLSNYQNSTVGLSLTIRTIPTQLVKIIGPESNSIQFLEDYTIGLVYVRTDTNQNVSLATMQVSIAPVSGLNNITYTWGDIYYIRLSAENIGRWNIYISVNKTDYISAYLQFELQVNPIDTTVNEFSLLEPLEHGKSYELIFNYQMSNGSGISGANVIPSGSGASWVHISELSGGLYVAILNFDEIGEYEVTLSFTRLGFDDAVSELVLEIVYIETSINEVSITGSIIFGRPRNLTFSYLIADNQSKISGAEVSASGPGAAWVSVHETVDGRYDIILTPEGLGEYEITMTFAKVGFLPKTSTFTFSVIPVTVQIVDLEGLTALEGQETVLSLRLVEVDTGNPVGGAIVQYQFRSATAIGGLNAFEEAQLGVYSATVIMPDADSGTSLRIYVNLENYTLDVDYYEALITPSVDGMSFIVRTFNRYLFIWFGVGALVVVGAGRRVQSKKRREENIRAQQIKRRFDDIRSILGVIIIHKNSGIPLYSQIVKGGIDEILISGFIAAITQFRSEFDVDQKNFAVTPISDIIRVVATENLICAFITLTPPSDTLEQKMIQYAQTIGFVFDHQFTEAPISVLDDSTQTQLDILFDDILDGALIQKYKLVEPKGLPRGSKCLEAEIAAIRQKEEFVLEDLAARMTSCGLEEAFVYKAIWEAIEKNQIQLIELDHYKDIEPISFVTEDDYSP